jgi:E3 ubiquitin-protein ligase MARCH6
MEINVALDELLGLRGPLSTLIRNLLWLLAFNATYLGIFGFFPKYFGSVMYSTILNTTVCDRVLKSIPYMHSEDENQTTVRSLLLSVEEASVTQNTTFKLSDFATVTLGYLSFAAVIVLSRNVLFIVRKIADNFGHNTARPPQVQETPLVPTINNEHREIAGHMDEGDDHEAINGAAGLGHSIGVGLDATVAVVKVAVLLFLKMFLLPLSLGLWLDVSTIKFFGHELQHRVAFAGGDLFSFLLLHWVAGITFMLLVTVFLLQLREVIHPDILARVIRPQEPQPDLLGNLMHETVSTHMKRMLVSFAIYAPLLTIHVSVPVYLFVSSGLGESFTFYHLNFYHIVTPQLEIPVELIIFHLCMLALLERYKNTIGGFQHRWLKFMCRKMGLTDYLLPCSIKEFELVGTKSILLPVDGKSAPQVDPFFLELVTKEDGIDEFILSNIHPVATPVQVVGETKDGGDRVLSQSPDHILLTPKSAEERKLLPTKIGRFRLRLQQRHLSPQPIMEFFVEVQGDEIKRPPEGWDDLGAGGAFVQGRWAWAKERKSVIEGGVAVRTSFRASPKGRRPLHLMLKVVALVLVSWIAIMFTTLAVLSLPLAVGRCFYYLLRIPGKYIHDPLAFCIGAGLFFPGISVVSHISNEIQGSFWEGSRRWVSRLHVPPTRKLLVAAEASFLWIFVAPVMLGVSYEIGLVKSPRWFAREEPVFDWKAFMTSWITGTVVLNTWSFLLYFNFFTRHFWAGIWNGILEPPPDDNGNENQARNNENLRRARNPNGAQQDHDAKGIDGVNQLPWQGQDGRVAKFFRIWRAVLVYWDWSKVDRTLLIEEFSRPVTKQLASALVGSSLSFQLAMYSLLGLFKVQVGGMALPFLGVVETGVVRKALFQLCMTFHVVVQLASGFRSSIDGWFEAAHDAARDDRYLIGELLMNYSPANDSKPQ